MQNYVEQKTNMLSLFLHGDKWTILYRQKKNIKFAYGCVLFRLRFDMIRFRMNLLGSFIYILQDLWSPTADGAAFKVMDKTDCWIKQ